MTDQNVDQMELRISKFLRAGVFVVAFFLFAGWIWQLANGVGSLEQFQTYQLVPWSEKWNVSKFSVGDHLVNIGLLVLILLPLLRVAMTFVLFVKRKEYLLAMAAGFVTFVLVFSFWMGFEL